MAYIDSSVFRAYDIRGIIGQQLDEADFFRIGQAIAYRLQALGRTKIIVARDGRLTSDALGLAIQKGLLSSGVDVINLGAVATPVMYYATHTIPDVDSGLIVTGSHNPADYNGIKIVLAGKTLVQEDIKLLYDLVSQDAYIVGKGIETSVDMMPDYVGRVTQGIHLKRPLRVVVDCGNGIAGPIIPRVLERLGCDVIELYCDVDGRFPHHHPDPTIEANLVDLKAAVKLHGADIGLAFDGDADRLGVITQQGEVIWPDRLMMFFAQHVLRENPRGTIVYDVKCSSHLASVIAEAGGNARMCPTGHSIVKGIMKEVKAVLAGEMSGHIFFNDRWYGFDDALYSACRLLEMLSISSLTVGEQFLLIPNSVNTPEIKIPIVDENKFSFMARFIAEAEFSNATFIDIDGIRVEFNDGWGLIRASNTTPCLVARFEAETSVALEKIQALFKVQLHAIDACLAVPF